MPRFFIKPDQVKEGVVLLDQDESRHAISVLRLKSGDAVQLLDGQGGSFSGVVIGTQNGRLSVMKTENLSSVAQPAISITLAVSVIKPERMELLIQKACELGISALVPILSERSIVRLSEDRWQGKIKRWQKIAKESCKQCA